MLSREDKLKLFKEEGFTYNHITGELFGKQGRLIKSKHKNGYLYPGINIKGIQYGCLGHILAWYLHYNEVINISMEIDHIDGNRSNNKIENLRIITPQQNRFNNHTCKGYYYHKTNKKWNAQIKVNRKNIYIGTFNTEQEARQAYLNAKEIYHKIP